MNICKTKEDFENIWPYNRPKAFKYPKQFPCVVDVEYQEPSKYREGLLDGAYVIQSLYPPDDIDIETFAKCLNYNKDTFVV